MNIFQRFGWFAVGLGLGILLVVFLFKGRDFQCTYLPNNRVLVNLNDQSFKYVELDSQSVIFSEICSDSSFLNAFLMRGDIDFGESKVVTRQEIKYSQYPIELIWEGLKWRALWERRNDTAALLSIQQLDD
ncbi:MAG: Uncharacterised protein [Owenweeksia sp. TMED14]|nr:MAG: Uncharacterised protein [Owenweeksia sp. TMED14]